MGKDTVKKKLIYVAIWNYTNFRLKSDTGIQVIETMCNVYIHIYFTVLYIP